MPRFTELLDLSPVEAGLLAGIPNLTGSLLRIPFGAWVDKAGGRKPFLVLLGLTIVGMAGLLALLWQRYPDEMGGTFPLLLALGVLIGCGIASFSVGIAQVAYWFPKREQGGPLGIYAGLGNTAPGLSSWLLPAAVAGLGILAAYGLWALVLIAITVTYGLFMRNAPWFQLRAQGREPTAEDMERHGQDLIPTGSTWIGLRRAAAAVETWTLVYFYFISFGGFLALTAWLPTYWRETYDTSLSQGGLLTLMFGLLTALVRVPGGILSDRISIRFALLGNFALIGAGTVVVSFSGTFVVSVLAVVTIAVGMGLQNAIVFKLVPHYVPQAIGGAAGWVGGLGALSGFMLPPIMGAVAGAVGGDLAYARSFLVLTGLVALGLLVVGWLTRWTWGSDVD